MLEIRLKDRVITIQGHHAEQLVALVIAAPVLLTWTLSWIWR